MPYFGARLNLDRFFLTIRIHGPLDSIPSGILSELKQFVPEAVDTYESENANLAKICKVLANDIKDKYLDGNQLVWVQVEITTKQNLIFGATAERVLVDTPG